MMHVLAGIDWETVAVIAAVLGGGAGAKGLYDVRRRRNGNGSPPAEFVRRETCDVTHRFLDISIQEIKESLKGLHEKLDRNAGTRDGPR